MIVNPSVVKKGSSGKVYVRGAGASSMGEGKKTFTLQFDEPIKGFYYYGTGYLGYEYTTGLIDAVYMKDQTGNKLLIATRHNRSPYKLYSAVVTLSADGKTATINTVEQNGTRLLDYNEGDYYYIGIPAD